MNPMFNIIKVFIGVLSFSKLKALGVLVSSLSFSLSIVAKLLYKLIVCYKILVYRGLNFIVGHTCHLDFH